MHYYYYFKLQHLKKKNTIVHIHVYIYNIHLGAAHTEIFLSLLSISDYGLSFFLFRVSSR